MQSPASIKSHSISTITIRNDTIPSRQSKTLCKSVEDSNLYEIHELDEKLRKYKLTIVKEEENLKNLSKTCQQDLNAVYENKRQSYVEEEKFNQINCRVKALERAKVQSYQKVKKIKEKIKVLEEARELKKKFRAVRKVQLKKINNEIKYAHLLSQ